MNLINAARSPKTYAQFAGLLYLLIAIAGGLSIAYIPSLIVLPEDVSTTTKNLIEKFDVFRWAIAGDIIVLVLEVFLTVFIYRIFRTVSQTASLIAAYSRVAMSIVMALNLFNYIIPILILNSSATMGSFELSQQESLSMLFLHAHKYGEYIWQLFFGIHLFVLGYMVIKSRYTPIFIGYLMLIGSAGYFGEGALNILFVENNIITFSKDLLLAVATIGELIFTFWLLIKGVKAPEKN